LKCKIIRVMYENTYVHIWEDNKLCECGLNAFVYDRDQWRALVNTLPTSRRTLYNSMYLLP